VPINIDSIHAEEVFNISNHFAIEEEEVEAFPVKNSPDELSWTLPYNPRLCYCYYAIPHDDRHLMPTKDHRHVCLVLKGDHSLGAEGMPNNIKLRKGDLFSFDPNISHWLYPPNPTPDNPYHTTRSPEDIYIQLEWTILRGEVNCFIDKFKTIISDLKSFIKIPPKEEDND
jgi:hypothetical protein